MSKLGWDVLRGKDRIAACKTALDTLRLLDPGMTVKAQGRIVWREGHEAFRAMQHPEAAARIMAAREQVARFDRYDRHHGAGSAAAIFDKDHGAGTAARIVALASGTATAAAA